MKQGLWVAFAVRAARPFTLVIFLLVAFAVVKYCDRAYSRELYPGQYRHVSPELRKWFRSQKSPATGGLCCNEADGITAEEDIRNGEYYTRFEPTAGAWLRVPPEVVLRTGNLNGAPVVWWYNESGIIKIRCYAPGSGL